MKCIKSSFIRFINKPPGFRWLKVDTFCVMIHAEERKAANGKKERERDGEEGEAGLVCVIATLLLRGRYAFIILSESRYHLIFFSFIKEKKNV